MLITTGRNLRHLTTGDLVHDVVFQPSTDVALLKQLVNAKAEEESESPVGQAPSIIK